MADRNGTPIIRAVDVLSLLCACGMEHDCDDWLGMREAGDGAVIVFCQNCGNDLMVGSAAFRGTGGHS